MSVEAPAPVSVPEMSAEDFRAHVKRVEMLVGLVEGVLKGAAAHPLFASVIPPDVMAEIRNL